MHPIRPQFKSCFSGYSSSFSSKKENLFPILPTPYPGSTSNSNQYVGDDAPDTQTLDSTLSKYTKCTETSYSDPTDDFESPFFVFEIPEKCSKK